MSMNNVNGKIGEAALLGGVTGMLKQAVSSNEIYEKGKTFNSIFQLQKNVSDNKIEMPDSMSLPLPNEVIETTDTFTFEGKSHETKYKLNIKQ